MNRHLLRVAAQPRAVFIDSCRSERAHHLSPATAVFRQSSRKHLCINPDFIARSALTESKPSACTDTIVDASRCHVPLTCTRLRAAHPLIVAES